MDNGVHVTVNSKEPDQSTEIYSLIRSFAKLRDVLHYPIILYADSEGPDQTARMRKLIWPIAVRRRVLVWRSQINLCGSTL